ncbi:MAG: ATP-binding protein [bacterium]|nr:ATP-binding protein [bacterium]
MVYNDFRFNCSLRLLFISATIILLFYLVYQTKLIATPFVVGLFTIMQVISLYHYIEKTNRDLARFLQSIKYSDFSQSFTSSAKGATFSELNASFNDVIKEFQRARAEKEEHYRYLQTVVQHIGICLIVYREDGEIVLMNGAAKRLLGVTQLNHLDQLNGISADLTLRLREIKAGEKAQLKLFKDENLLHLSIYATKFRMHQESFTLVSLQNIQPELEEKEMEAWQNLIRVLTHEIMNSITPISSLASTANSLLAQKYGTDNQSIHDETITDVSEAVRTIERRSKNLMNFVDDYRKLTRIPRPNFELISVHELLIRTRNLMKDQLEKQKIKCQIHIDPESLEITADPTLIEQVLINLCKNAAEALVEKQQPEIELSAKTDGRGNPVIQVIDNGPGIRADVIEKIFIPFFTTKKDGSGIGLSLSRQIMRVHGGTLNVTSRPDQETVFTLRF